ncbi:hypothetical protein Kim5_CH03441 [Rhizobium sp. Kim5]|nr:hypothetical protein Kim5_CH03441 [Rhizobium sp. Kim5]
MQPWIPGSRPGMTEGEGCGRAKFAVGTPDEVLLVGARGDATCQLSLEDAV